MKWTKKFLSEPLRQHNFFKYFITKSNVKMQQIWIIKKLKIKRQISLKMLQLKVAYSLFQQRDSILLNPRTH